MSDNVRYEAMQPDRKVADLLGTWTVEFWKEQISTASVEKISTYFLKASYNHGNSLPKVILAWDGDELAGGVVVADEDLPEFKQYGPWLSSLIVNPKYRDTGVGRQLALEAQSLAKRMGYKKIYAFTTHLTEWALRWHWKPIEKGKFKGLPVDVIEKELHWDYI